MAEHPPHDAASEAAPDKYSDEFLAEARDLVQSIVVDVLALEEQGEAPDPAILNRIFRAAHSLKGLAGMFGATTVAHVGHALEDLLDALRLGRERLTRDVLDLLFEVPGVLESLLAGDPAEDAARDLAGRLRVMAGPGGRAPLPPPPFELPREILDVLSEYEIFRLHEAARRGHNLSGLRAEIDIATLEEDLGALKNELASFGEVVSAVPTGAGGPGNIGFHVVLASQMPAGELAQALDQPVEAYPRIVRDAREVSALTAPTRAPKSSVRVEIARLDSLLNTASELSVTGANLARLADRMQAEAAFSGYGLELAREVRTLDRRVRTLRDDILQARLVPLTPLFARVARLVRGIAREAGKEVGFATSGDETELDKLMVEQLSDPLLHLMRNAVDHGIEDAQARAHRGKPPRGQVSLEARAEGNRVVLVVRDDGAGIDAARIREAAVERGLLSAEEAQRLDDKASLSLLFLPGFTTRPEVNELSGRGVGLDVVLTNIERLSGSIAVSTSPGDGTSFSLSLPVTLAILPALLVRVRGEAMAMPLGNVAETLLVPAAQGEGGVLELRGMRVPCADLAAHLGFPASSNGDGRGPARAGAADTEGEARRGERPAVVVGGGGDRLTALLVDELIGQQDVVVKPLGALLGDVPGVAGVAELGAGELVLVLDAASLVREAPR